MLGLPGGALFVLARVGTPLALQRLALFRVRQIELVGVKHLAPDAVIAALRLSPDASVFTDTRLLSDRLRGLAGVAEARALRPPPGGVNGERDDRGGDAPAPGR